MKASTNSVAIFSEVVWSVAKPLRAHFESQELYCRYNGSSYCYDRGCYIVEEKGKIQFDCLLNLFALRQWKTFTGASDFGFLATHVGGGAKVHVMGYDGSKSRLIKTMLLAPSDEISVTRMPLPMGIRDELLFLQIEGEHHTEIYDLSFSVVQVPSVDVKLGIVITTFNRPDDVEDQAVLLEALAFSGLEYKVIVVDNGSNLSLSRQYINTSILASPNLGGAGGFTRGLLELACTGVTHVMFMDDDAFCHPAAIQRGAALLRFTNEPRLALSGAMNYLHAPATQYELGGRIADYGVRSIRMNAEANSLRAAFDNLKAETPAYGAWWCFIFPVQYVDVLPFPFFVRGDDIAFSLQNSFRIVGMPGLLAWQPSFEYKIGAVVEYLAHRSFLTLPLLVPGQWKKTEVLGGVRHAFRLEVDGLRYPIAQGICDALEDILTGPAFWANAANTLARVKRLGLIEKEFSASSFLPNWIFKGADVETRRLMGWARARFGHVNLPARLCWRRPVLTNDMAPKMGQAAFRQGMIYHSPDDSRSLSCARDWRWRRRLQRRFNGLISEYDRRFDELGALYSAGQSSLQSRDGWEAQFASRPAEVHR